MGRFYRPTTATPVDYMYKVNAPLMQSVVLANDKYINQYLAGAEKLNQLGHEFKYAPQDREKATQHMANIGVKADTITNAIHGDAANWRQQRGALDDLTKDLYNDYTSGAISAYAGNAARRQTAFDAADNMSKLWIESGGTKGQDPTTVEAFKNYWDKGFEGTDYDENKPNSYNIYKGGAVPNYMDVPKIIEEGMDKVKTQKNKEYFETEEGAFWRDKHTNIVEQITPEKILSIGMGNIGPKVMNYLGQMAQVGLVDPKSLVNPYSIDPVPITDAEGIAVMQAREKVSKIKDKEVREAAEKAIDASVKQRQEKTQLNWNDESYFAGPLRKAVNQYSGITNEEHMVERTVDSAKTMLYEQAQTNARSNASLAQADAHFKATNTLAQDKFIYEKKKDTYADQLEIYKWNHPQPKTASGLGGLGGLDIGALTGQTPVSGTTGTTPIAGAPGVAPPSYQVYRDTATGEIKPLLDANGNMIPVQPVGTSTQPVGLMGAQAAPTPAPASGDGGAKAVTSPLAPPIKFPLFTGKDYAHTRDFNSLEVAGKDGVTPVKLYSNEGLAAQVERDTRTSNQLKVNIADMQAKLLDPSLSQYWGNYKSQLGKFQLEKLEVDRNLTNNKSFIKAAETAVMMDSPKAGDNMVTEDDKKLYKEFMHDRKDPEGEGFKKVIQNLETQFPGIPTTVQLPIGGENAQMRFIQTTSDSPQVAAAKTKLKNYLNAKEHVEKNTDNWLRGVRTDMMNYDAIKVNGKDSKETAKIIMDNATGDMKFFTEDGSDATGWRLDKDHAMTFAGGSFQEFMDKHGLSMNVIKIADSDRLGNGNALAQVVFTDVAGKKVLVDSNKNPDGSYYIPLTNEIQDKIGTKFMANSGVSDIASNILDRERRSIRQQLIRPNINDKLGLIDPVEDQHRYTINVPYAGQVIPLEVTKIRESDGEESYFITKYVKGEMKPLERLTTKTVNGKNIVVVDPDTKNWGHFSDADDLNKQLKLDKIRQQLVAYKYQQGDEQLSQGAD